MINNFLNPTAPNTTGMVELLYYCIRDGKIAAALLLTKSLEKSECADVLFNIALTYNLIGDFIRAIEYIDLALGAIKKIAPMTRPLPRPQNFQTARMIEIKNKSYLNAADAKYAAEFPDLFMSDILMAGTIIADTANMSAKKANYLSQLHGAEFEEFKKGV